MSFRSAVALEASLSRKGRMVKNRPIFLMPQRLTFLFGLNFPRHLAFYFQSSDVFSQGYLACEIWLLAFGLALMEWP